jgi:hypothetical protein
MEQERGEMILALKSLEEKMVVIELTEASAFKGQVPPFYSEK